MKVKTKRLTKKGLAGYKPGEMPGRHGDVGLILIASIPEDAQRSTLSVLAEGEVTGHAHRLVGDYAMYERGGQLFFRVGDKGAKLTHEDHGIITLPACTCFQSIIQREWSPEGERRVVD